MIRWYPRLNNTYKDGLLSNVTPTKDYLIVCKQEEIYRGFAMFSPLYTFANYLLKTPIGDRCFYEVIQGNSHQKPYFDIDISDSKVTLQDANEMIDSLKISILQDERISEDDIMIFSSHGEEKKSFHVIINGWCLPDHNSVRNYCHKIIERIDHPLKVHIDSLVYKNVQQLRTFGSTKKGKDRYKILTTDNSWIQDTNERARFFKILLSSLVTNTNSCKVLEYSEPIKRVFSYESEDLEESELKLIDDLGFMKDGTFSVQEIRGRMVLLKRHASSFCRKCNRNHEAENPYLIFTNQFIVFHCRRSGDDGYIVAVLPEKKKELESQSIAPSKVTPTKQMTKFMAKFLGKK